MCLISSMPSILNKQDRWIWKTDIEKSYIVNDMSRRIDESLLFGHFQVSGHPTIRIMHVPSKVNIFAWRANRKRIPVLVELDKRGIDLNSLLCPICEEMVETVDHCLVSCCESMLVWSKVLSWWNFDNFNLLDLEGLVQLNYRSGSSKLEKELWTGVMWIALYLIWKNRNAKVFGGKFLKGLGLAQEIQVRSFEWLKPRIKNFILEWDRWIKDPRDIEFKQLVCVS